MMPIPLPEIIEFVEARHSYDGSFLRPHIHAILVDIAQKRGGPAGQIEPRRFGKWMNKNENAIAAGLKLTIDYTDKRRLRYRLQQVLA